MLQKENSMKKLFILLSLCLCCIGSAAPLQNRFIWPAALDQLASAMDMPASEDLITFTQTHWLRKPAQERWEMKELTKDQRTFVLNWADRQGLFADWLPYCDIYDTALILGASTSRMQMRLDYLKKLWNQGVRFKEVVWLTGDRPLDERVDGMIERCQNESQAARIIWEESDLPDSMRCLPALFIAVPMKGEEPVRQRPNTADTIIAWLQTNPPPCKALFVSDQPFCGYQFAIVKAFLPDAFSFDLVGQGVDPFRHPAAAAITLDSIARWIYQENLNKNTAKRAFESLEPSEADRGRG